MQLLNLENKYSKKKNDSDFSNLTFENSFSDLEKAFNIRETLKAQTLTKDEMFLVKLSMESYLKDTSSLRFENNQDDKQTLIYRNENFIKEVLKHLKEIFTLKNNRLGDLTNSDSVENMKGSGKFTLWIYGKGNKYKTFSNSSLPVNLEQTSNHIYEDTLSGFDTVIKAIGQRVMNAGVVTEALCKILCVIILKLPEKTDNPKKWFYDNLYEETSSIANNSEVIKCGVSFKNFVVGHGNVIALTPGQYAASKVRTTFVYIPHNAKEDDQIFFEHGERNKEKFKKVFEQKTLHLHQVFDLLDNIEFAVCQLKKTIPHFREMFSLHLEALQRAHDKNNLAKDRDEILKLSVNFFKRLEGFIEDQQKLCFALHADYGTIKKQWHKTFEETKSQEDG